jgi:hypothetical protein
MGERHSAEKLQGGNRAVKNMMAVNCRPGGKISEEALRQLVNVQVENSLTLGWAPQDILIVTNMDLDVPVTVVRTPLNETCLTGSKMFALDILFALGLIRSDEVWWAHDLDAWQNHWFEPPHFLDIGLAEYSKPKFNGGSIFLRAEARDMVTAILEKITASKARQEEPAINTVLRSTSFKDRVTVLNSTYNVGCSAYAVRHGRSEKPILVSHFNPKGKTSWNTHIFGDRRLPETSVSPRLFTLLVRHFHNGVAPRQRIPR